MIKVDNDGPAASVPMLMDLNPWRMDHVFVHVKARISASAAMALARAATTRILPSLGEMDIITREQPPTGTESGDDDM